MPKPATTHPIKRIAGAPTRTPTTTRTTSAAPPRISRPVGPAAATAAGWAAPSTASVSLPRSAGYFAASAGGAKERVAQGGAHTSGVPARSAGGCAATGPLTPASAPLSGSPRNRKIPWGEQAPVRLGREDPRSFGSETLTRESQRPPGECNLVGGDGAQQKGGAGVDSGADRDRDHELDPVEVAKREQNRAHDEAGEDWTPAHLQHGNRTDMAPCQDPARDAQHHLGEDSGDGSTEVMKERNQEKVEEHVGDQAPAGGPRERLLVVGGAQGSDEGVVDEADRQCDRENAQRRFRLWVQEHRRQRVRQHEEADRDRPTHYQQSLEETAHRIGQLLRALSEIDGEHREHDREKRHRDEQQSLERLVRGGVPARLGVRAECVEDRLVDLEIKDGEHERQGERQALKKPLAQQPGLELPSDGRDLSPVEDDGEIRAAEGILSRVGPNEIGDAGADLDADEHEGEKDGALQHDRRRFVAQALNGIKGVAKQRRIGGQDH